MRLDVRRRAVGHRAVAVRLAQQVLLAVGAGGDQAVAAAVVVDGGAHHDAVDPVTVGEGPAQRLDVQRGDALAADEAVGGGGEGLAAAVRGEPAEVGEPDGDVRVEDQVDAADDGRVDLAAAQGLDGEVQGDQRGGAAGLDREAGPAQLEEVREPGGDHVQRVAVQAVRGGPGAAAEPQQFVVVPGGADVHAGAAAGQGVGGLPGVLQGAPAGFQQQALLGVDGGGLARGDPEEAGVELVHPVEEAADGLDVLLRVERAGGVPAFGGHRADRVPALHQQGPQAVGVGGSGELPGHADHGDRLGGVVGRVRVHSLPFRLYRKSQGSPRNLPSAVITGTPLNIPGCSRRTPIPPIPLSAGHGCVTRA